MKLGPEVSNKTYKVIVWATGRVGKLAIRAAAERPTLELTGVWVHSEAKDGQDAGTLTGIEPLGVRATRDASTLLDGDADCVIYTGPATSRPREAIEDFCTILRSGKNIVTTSLPGLVYPRGSMRESALRRIVDAAHAGNASIYSSGIEPGFGCDLFAAALTSMSHRVFSVRGLEITDYSRDITIYEMRELFGFGQPLDYQGGIKIPGVIKFGWGAAVTMVAESLGVELDEIRETCEFAPSPRRLETASGVIEPGAVGAIWFRCIGVVDGQEVITVEHVDRMAEEPRWRHRRGLARHHRRRTELRRRIRSRLQPRRRRHPARPARHRHARNQCHPVGMRSRTRPPRRLAHADHIGNRSVTTEPRRNPGHLTDRRSVGECRSQTALVIHRALSVWSTA